jgi:hypothetical protein
MARHLRLKNRISSNHTAQSKPAAMPDLQAERRQQLVQAVQTIVCESGEHAGFDAAVWLDDWLRRPLPALGGRLPVEYLDSDEGYDLLAQLLHQMQSGAFS